MLHRINNSEWFESIINLLSCKYEFVGPDFFCHDRNPDRAKPSVHITADDGDISFYKYAYPVFKKYNIPATLFVSPHIIKTNENYWFQYIEKMDKILLFQLISEKYKIPLKIVKQYPKIEIFKLFRIAEIQEVIKEYKKVYHLPKFHQNVSKEQFLEMVDSGLIVPGAHTINHPILSNESYEVAYSEIANSIHELSALTNRQVRYFAYPNGTPKIDFSEREIGILKSLNIKIAFSTRVDYLRGGENFYDIPRIGLSYGKLSFVKSKLFFGKHWSSTKKIARAIKGNSRTQMKKMFFHYFNT